jgi:hypothetical protein
VTASWLDPPDPLRTDGENDKALADALDSKVNELYESPREISRRDQMLFDMQLYFGRKFATLFSVTTSAGWGSDSYDYADMNLRFNHCYSICSTVRNRICSFRPRSEFLPDGGDYLAERNAEDMSALNEGWSAQVGRQRTMSLWFRDLEVCDAAFVKLYRDGRNIELGRFPAWEFLLDEVETMYGKVETMHHVQFLPVETVSARYGIDTEKLMAEAITMGPGIPYYAPRQVIRVVDSYSGAMEVEDEKAEGGWRTEMGRHTIFVGRTHVVLDEDWEWEGPPVVIGTFEEGMTGVLGVSAVRMLRGIQEATNEWCARMENSHAMSSLQVWQVAEGENGPSKINNADVRIERYASRPSNVINPPPMGTEAYNWSKLLRDEGYATIGVSQFIAAGIKQPYFGRKFATLFSVTTSAGWGSDSYDYADMNLRFNHCYSICSTVRNRICSFRPRSEFLPDGGDYLAERNAEDMSALNEGWSAQVGRQRTMSLWFRDLEVCDAAFVKLYRDGRNIELGRFPAWEFLLDEVETMYGKVETMHHVQFLPVETVSARYGIDTEKLMAEAITMGPGIPYYAPRQVIRVVDSYSGAMEVEDEKAEGGWRTEMGRHTIFVGRTHVVLDEDWEWEGPPVVIGTFEEGMTGVLGVSAVRMLRGIQEATNEWCARMENSHAMSSLQVWQVAEGENGPSKINNADVRIERYASRPSNVINPPPMGTEAYNWSKLLRDEGYATIGVSQFIAAGIKQPSRSRRRPGGAATATTTRT